MVTFFIRDRSSPAQYTTLRFLTSLCGGIAAYFISGNALFNLKTTLGGGGSVTVSGTAGAAIFFTVWFFYPKRQIPKPPDAFYFSVPENISFESMARVIVNTSHQFVRFENFSDQQLEEIRRYVGFVFQS
jgi:hypothetical protein